MGAWDCDEVMRQLGPWADGELPPAARQRVASHLEGCEGCRRAAAALRRLGDAVREAEGDAALTPDEAAAFWPAVRARLRAAAAARERRGLAAAARALALRLRPAGLVPALAAFVGLVLGVGLLRTEYLADEAEAAQVESVEAGPASTVMLIQEGRGKPPVIWIFEDGAGAN